MLEEAKARPLGPQSKYSLRCVFCESWCADFEFRGSTGVKRPDTDADRSRLDQPEVRE